MSEGDNEDYKTKFLLLQKDVEIEKLKREIASIKISPEVKDTIYECKVRTDSRQHDINFTLERYRGKIVQIKYDGEHDCSHYMLVYVKIYQTSYHQIINSERVWACRDSSYARNMEVIKASNEQIKNLAEIELNKKYYILSKIDHGEEYMSFTIKECFGLKVIDK